MTAAMVETTATTDAELVERLRETAEALEIAAPRRSRTASDAASRIVALSAEVERLTKERDEAVNWNAIVDRAPADKFDELAEQWVAQEAIQRVRNAVASVFSRWANEPLMVRFRDHMDNAMKLAFAEGAICGYRSAEARALAAERQRDEQSERADAAEALIVALRKALRLDWETADEFIALASQMREDLTAALRQRDDLKAALHAVQLRTSHLSSVMGEAKTPANGFAASVAGISATARAALSRLPSEPAPSPSGEEEEFEGVHPEVSWLAPRSAPLDTQQLLEAEADARLLAPGPVAIQPKEPR